MEVTNLQLFVIWAVCLVAAIYYVWRSEPVQRAEFDAKQRVLDDEERRERLEKMDAYNDACNGAGAPKD